MRRRGEFSADDRGIVDAVDFITSFLSDNKVRKKDSVWIPLTVEEAVSSLVAHSRQGSSIKVSAKAFLGTITLDITCKGEAYDLTGSMPEGSELKAEREDAAWDAIRAILMRAHTDKLKYAHKDGDNRIRMTVLRSRHAFLIHTVIALLLGILTGFVLSGTGNEILAAGMNKYLLSPIKGMFLNVLKMVVAPVVFFSITTCIMQFSNLSELGRIGGKVILSYLITTFIAVGVGLALFFLLRPGVPQDGFVAAAAQSVTEETPLQDMLLDMVNGIVPDNLFKPFIENNMLQLIFLAVICGTAVGMIGQYSDMLRGILEACNELFLKITTMIMRFMPIAVFCSTVLMFLSFGGESLLSVLGMVGTFLLGLVFMMLIYCILLMVFGRMNPASFFRVYAPVMLQVFSIASSSASIPVNMKACEKLGIRNKIYSFSIPLGATINMDATCVMLAIFSLSLARICGAPITGAAVVSLAISIVVLSIGAPGVPGSVVICLSALLSQLSVPVDMVGLVMGVGPLTGMFLSMSNCLGDVVVTAIVARSEGLMDNRFSE